MTPTQAHASSSIDERPSKSSVLEIWNTWGGVKRKFCSLTMFLKSMHLLQKILKQRWELFVLCFWKYKKYWHVWLKVSGWWSCSLSFVGVQAYMAGPTFQVKTQFWPKFWIQARAQSFGPKCLTLHSLAQPLLHLCYNCSGASGLRRLFWVATITCSCSCATWLCLQ